MKKSFLLMSCIIAAFCANAQTTPDHYYLNSSNGANMSTFNSASHVRSQYLYYPSDFQTPFTGGTITAIYIRPSGNQTNSTFDSLTIQIGTTTQTQLTSGAWVNYNFDTVFYSNQHIFPTVSSNSWLKIELDRPYTWDGISNLVIDLSQRGYTRGFAQAWHNPGGSPAPRMKYGGMTTPTYLNNFPPIFMGFDVCNTPVVNLGNDTLLCGEVSLTLDAGNAGATYLWSDNSTNQTLTVSSPGTYYVTVDNNGCSATDSITITTGRTATASGINTFNVGNGTYNFSLNNPANITSYEWNFGDGNTSTVASPNHTYTIPGKYVVTVKIGSECGSLTLTDTLEEHLSVEGVHAQKTIKIYPNPTKQFINIATDIKLDGINIYNVLGQKVMTPLHFNQKTIDVSSLPIGVYMLEMISDDRTWMEKFEIIK